jgi:hypothetical protein
VMDSLGMTRRNLAIGWQLDYTMARLLSRRYLDEAASYSEKASGSRDCWAQLDQRDLVGDRRPHLVAAPQTCLAEPSGGLVCF